MPCLLGGVINGTQMHDGRTVHVTANACVLSLT